MATAVVSPSGCTMKLVSLIALLNQRGCSTGSTGRCTATTRPCRRIQLLAAPCLVLQITILTVFYMGHKICALGLAF